MFLNHKKLWLVIIIIIALGWYLARNDWPGETFTYGASFSRFHTDELELNWQEVFSALLNLGIKNFRFSAHWPLTEPKPGVYNFKELDWQMQKSRERGARVILAVGRRLPGWPECHVPEWAKDLSQEKQQEQMIKLITTVVNRYKNFENLQAWQVENEPYLAFFSRSACGALDEELLKKEIATVRSLDPKHPIVLTDSGEISLWHKAYRQADIFGTTMYLYVWNSIFGPMRYPITPAFFRIKRHLVEIFDGRKSAMVSELSAEPWLTRPIVQTPINEQLDRMGIDKFNETLAFAQKTGFTTFYFWGAEWWYWMKLHGHPEFWNRAQEIF